MIAEMGQSQIKTQCPRKDAASASVTDTVASTPTVLMDSAVATKIVRTSTTQPHGALTSTLPAGTKRTTAANWTVMHFQAACPCAPALNQPIHVHSPRLPLQEAPRGAKSMHRVLREVTAQRVQRRGASTMLPPLAHRSTAATSGRVAAAMASLAPYRLFSRRHRHHRYPDLQIHHRRRLPPSH